MVTGVEHLLALALALTSLTGLYTVYTADEKYQAVLGVSRFLILLFISLAVAGPQMNLSEERMQSAEITVLQDNSRSTQFMDYEGLNLEDVEVNREVIASGNNSDIKAGLERNLEENSAYLVVSDLQTDEDLGPTIEKYRQQNSSVSFLKPEMETEHSVHIQGPEKTVPGAENRYTVKLHSTEEEAVPITVTVDGETVYEDEIGDNYTFTRQFESKGRYRLKASIDVGDRKEENNQYFKTVEVTEKPDVLVVGERSGLESDLQQYFDLEVETDLPEDLSTYDSILLKKDVPEEQLIPYISEGNGLVYTGDYNSNYDILPVKKVPGSSDDQGTKVVLAVDTSSGIMGYNNTAGGITYSREGAFDSSMMVAGAFIKEGLPASSRVGILDYGQGGDGGGGGIVRSSPSEPAFLTLAYPSNRQRLLDRVSSLRDKNRISQLHSVGLRKAKEMADGEGNIVMITDGRVTGWLNFSAPRDRQETKEVAESLDVPLYIVTVGNESQKDMEFIRSLTAPSRIRSADSVSTLNLWAGGGASGVGEMRVTNPNHFITEGSRLDSNVIGLDSVELRSSGNQLISTQKGDPVLSTWRYGLGRVAAFSADNENLAGMMRNNPSTVIRTFSWTVGEKDREGDWISISSARKGESRPEVEASYSIEGLSRTAEGTYSTELETGSTGFHTFDSVPYSVNYNSELQEIGYSDRIESVAEETGGNVYRPDDKSEIVDDLQSFSSEKVVRKTSLTPYFLVAALVVFLVEVAFRKFKGRK